MTFAPDLGRRLSSLEAENEELRERLDWYRVNVFGSELRFPIDWHLTPTEERLLAALLSPLEYMSTEALMIAMYDASPDDEPDDKVIDVFVCKLRKKVKPYGIEIRTIFGRGFAIPNPRRRELRLATRLISSPPWEHPSVPLPSHESRTAERSTAQDRSAYA